MLAEERRKMTVLDNFEKSDSEYSMNIDRVMKIRSIDPKEMKSLDSKAKDTKKKDVQRSERSDLENKEYFRQNETKYQETALVAQKQKGFDMTITNMMQEVGERLLDDLKTGVTKKKNRINAESYVDRYGKESPGFITFKEFKDIYMTHVFYADEMSEKRPKPDINKLTALFNAIDTSNRQKISREEFKDFIINKRPSGNFLQKLEKKALKGKERFCAAIQSEMTSADQVFGSHGVLPLGVF
jgi:hypothetical protein